MTWQTYPLEDCIEDIFYTNKIQRKDFLVTGRFPVVSQEDGLVNGYWNNESDVFKLTRPLVVFGDHTRAIKYVDFDFVLGADGVKLLQPKEFLEPRFFYYQLQNVELPSLGYARHYRLLREQSLRVPSLAEQHRIAALLDEAFAGIATAKANTDKSLRNVREVDAAYRQSIFIGRGWTATTLDRIAKNLDSRRIPITKGDREPGEYPYYGASGIVDFVADYIFDGDALLVSEDGANLLARSTSIAFSVTGKYWVNNHAHILEFEEMATQKFVEFYLESIPLDDYITGAAQPKLNQKALNSIPVPMPSTVRGRAEVVSQIEAMQLESKHLQSLYTRKLAALEALKQSLLHQAFSGQL